MYTKKYYNIAKSKLFHLCRSITGNGIRKSLKIIKKEFPKLKIVETNSKSKAFDWTVPLEWNIKDAYILDKNDKKIVNFKNNNLHVISYSVPVKKILSLKDLTKRLFSLPKQPSAIPYITSYYKKNWGFCISDTQKKKLLKIYSPKDKFKIIINSKFKKGKLTYGEVVIKGKSRKEILISTYICHPSMANNELSGPMVR